MATDAQVTANRANAHRSTGPQSPAGKAASSENSTLHGFRSRTVLLPGDDPDEYEDLLDELRHHFQAKEDLTEDRCIREMADAEWRLRRVRQYIEITLTRKINELAAAHPDQDPIELQALAYEQLEKPLATYFRYESQFERRYDRAYRQWSGYQHGRGRKQTNDIRRMLLSLELPPPGTPVPIPAEAPTPANKLRNATNEPNPEANETRNATNEPNPALPTPRNASCPCGSGRKYKRCCGHDAPPVLFPAA